MHCLHLCFRFDFHFIFPLNRVNGGSYDLNRNFPDYWSENKVAIQPETQAIMKWVQEQQFVLSANFHGGALVANYPFDNYPNGIPLASISSYLRNLDLSNTRKGAIMSTLLYVLIHIVFAY